MNSNQLFGEDRKLDGFANGHCQFMVCGVTEQQFFRALNNNKEIQHYYYLGENLQGMWNGEKKNGAIFFDTEKCCYEETCQKISALLPSATVYASDEWNEMNVVCYRQGKECDEFIASLEEMEPSDEPNTWDIDLEIKDIRTGASMNSGGGYKNGEEKAYVEKLASEHPEKEMTEELTAMTRDEYDNIETTTYADLRSFRDELKDLIANGEIKLDINRDCSRITILDGQNGMFLQDIVDVTTKSGENLFTYGEPIKDPYLAACIEEVLNFQDHIHDKNIENPIEP